MNPQARGAGPSVVDAAAEDAHSRLRHALAWCRRPAHLRRTVRLALLVGLILTAVNQLQVLLEGRADAATWVRCAANFVIPFIVANLGLLSARGASPSEGGACGRGTRDGYDRRR